MSDISQGPSPLIPSSVGQRGVLAAGVVTVFAAMLPWVTVSIFGVTLTKNGYEGDGAITLVVGAVLAAVAFVNRPRWPAIVAVVCCVLIGGVAIYDVNDVASSRAASVGIGLWLTLGAAIGGLVAGAVWLGLVPKNAEGAPPLQAERGRDGESGGAIRW